MKVTLTKTNLKRFINDFSINDFSNKWGSTFQLVANIVIIITVITILYTIRQFDIQIRSFKINVNNIAIEAIDKMHDWYRKNDEDEIDKMHNWYSKNDEDELVRECKEFRFLEEIAAYYNYISIFSSDEYQSHKNAISTPEINLRNGIYDVLKRRVLRTLKRNKGCGYYPNELMKFMKYADFSDLNEKNRTRIEKELNDEYNILKKAHEELYKLPPGAPPDFPFSP